MEKKEAIKILKDFHDESALFSIRNALETLYPEFKESRDEKIRKRLIEFFKDWGKTRSHCWSIYIPDILAWLEKQGEQEPINPELKESEDEKVRKEIVEYLKKNLRLEWATWLEKQGEVESDNDDIEDEKQCKQKPQRMISAEAKEAMYDKPACVWSEEDEEMLVDAYVMLDWYKGNNWWTARRIKDWLKSLKTKVQPKQEWSEEDGKMINKLMAVVKLYYVIDDDLDKQSCLSWLESLKQRV